MRPFWLSIGITMISLACLGCGAGFGTATYDQAYYQDRVRQAVQTTVIVDLTQIDDQVRYQEDLEACIEHVASKPIALHGTLLSRTLSGSKLWTGTGMIGQGLEDEERRDEIRAVAVSNCLRGRGHPVTYP